jgi:hypothetical protein
MPKKKRGVRKAPKPIVPVQSSWIPPLPKPIQPPTDWPVYYPRELIACTEVIVGEGLKRFPVQTEMLPFCGYVIAELGPHLCRVLGADLVLTRMGDLIDSLLVANYRDSSERFMITQELRKSDEWRALARRVAGSFLAAEESTASGNHPMTRRTQVDAFLSRMSQSAGREINRKDFSTAAGYQDDTQFQRWQRDDPRISTKASRKFESVLRMTPDEFLAELAKNTRT